MLIFFGHGWTVPAFSFGCCLGCELLVNRIANDDAFYAREPWPIPAALCTAAVLLAAVETLIRNRAVRRGEELPRFRLRDSFFFVPLNLWPPILLTAAAARVAGFW